MADEVKKIELSAIERQWIAVALKNQQSVLQRQVAKETNIAIVDIRKREIGELSALALKF